IELDPQDAVGQFGDDLFHDGYLGNSTYAMPLKFPSANRSAFFSDPSKLQRYTEPPRSVKNMRAFFKSKARPIPSMRWVKTISGSSRRPDSASIAARFTVLP